MMLTAEILRNKAQKVAHLEWDNIPPDVTPERVRQEDAALDSAIAVLEELYTQALSGEKILGDDNHPLADFVQQKMIEMMANELYKAYQTQHINKTYLSVMDILP